jgi:hypothetical protein
MGTVMNARMNFHKFGEFELVNDCTLLCEALQITLL